MRRIVFICTENSNRSQIAEAFARRFGSDTVEAFSAGSRPSGEINPQAVRSMATRGYDLAGQRSKSIADLPEQDWDYVVTMGCGDACPTLAARHRLDWNLPDPRDLPSPEYDAVRDEIELRVRQLLDSLQ